MKSKQQIIREYFQAEASTFQLGLKADQALADGDWHLFFTLITPLAICEEGLRFAGQELFN